MTHELLTLIMEITSLICSMIFIVGSVAYIKLAGYIMTECGNQRLLGKVQPTDVFNVVFTGKRAKVVAVFDLIIALALIVNTITILYMWFWK